MRLNKAIFLLYGITAYLAFFATITYAIGFVNGYLVPKGIDDGTQSPLIFAVAVNLALLGIFGLQHSVMARPGFKRWWTRYVPQPIERSTYVLFSSLILAATFYFWQPITALVWQVENPLAAAALHTSYFVGWALVFGSSFIINHFDLFGLKQVFEHAIDRRPTPPSFVVRSLYRLVRHPLMLGFLIVMWSAPTMTLGHLLFSLGTTAYIFVGLRFEERDLANDLGDQYRRYQENVPMVIPFAKGRRSGNPQSTPAVEQSPAG